MCRPYRGWETAKYAGHRMRAFLFLGTTHAIALRPIGLETILFHSLSWLFQVRRSRKRLGNECAFQWAMAGA
jgi:hypothetical protein